MGVQHVMLIYSEIVFLPVIIGRKAGVPMDHILFASLAAGVASGLITLIQVVRLGRFGTGYTLFMGSSAAYLAGSLETLKAGGFPLLCTLSILVAPIEILMGYFLRYLRHIITPAVGGVILLLVVLSLVPLSVSEWMGETGHVFFASQESFLTGLTTMLRPSWAYPFSEADHFESGRRSSVWAPAFSCAGYLDLLQIQESDPISLDRQVSGNLARPGL